jgi:DNA repair exonuclease SbcCD nuclease subunit
VSAPYPCDGWPHFGRTHTLPPVTPAADLRRPATVLHTSDCHLGAADLPGAEEDAFAAALALARHEEVDAVLVVGDLFDSARVSDTTLEWTAAQFDSLSCPVVVIPGNHDVLDVASVHHRFDLATRCPNVAFIAEHDGRLVMVPDTDLVVWGRAMVAHEPGYHPFAGLPIRPTGKWTIAAGHGLVTDDGPALRSSPIFTSALASVEWDYVALGHVHRYRAVRDEPTPVRYSGATAEAHGAGNPGVVLVDFVPGTGARPRPVELAQAVAERHETDH